MLFIISTLTSLHRLSHGLPRLTLGVSSPEFHRFGRFLSSGCILRLAQNFLNDRKIAINDDPFIEFTLHFLPPTAPHLGASLGRQCNHPFQLLRKIHSITGLAQEPVHSVLHYLPASHGIGGYDRPPYRCRLEKSS